LTPEEHTRGQTKDRAINLTKRAIEGLPTPREGKRVAYHDTRVPGLGVMVQPNGNKIFFWFRKLRGRRTWKTLGEFPALTVENARDKAQEINASVARWRASDYVGPSPLERPHRDLTLNEVIEDYCVKRLGAHAKNPERACKGVRWSRDKYLSNWKNRPLGSITRKQVRDLHHELGKKSGHVTANRTITLLRTLFNWAIKAHEWKGENPATRLERFPETSRDRFLLADEATRLFTELRREPSRDLQTFVVLALFTGARMSDILSMRWRDLNFETNTWLIPNPKSKTPYVVPLLPEAIEALKIREQKSEWVFPGRGKTMHLTGFKHSWPALLKRAKVKQFRIHDLRRTMGSWMAMGGASLPVIGKALGHARSLGATSIYARLQTDAVRTAMETATRLMLNAKPTE
jgi:integrase